MPDKQKLIVHIGNEEIDVPLPNGMTLRTQNKDCNKNQKVCAKMDGNLVCAKIIMKENNEGQFEFFSLVPCKYNQNGKVMEI